MRRLVFVICLSLAACSSAKKKTPELSELEGKRIAVVEIKGESTARRIVEVALVNQIAKRGTFELINKRDIQKVRNRPEIKVDDWSAIGRAVGADYVLQAEVVTFDATTREGYSEEVVHDSVLEEERGDGETKRLYKVRSMTGTVAIDIRFTELATGDVRSALAKHSDKVVVEAKNRAAHLPPKLRYLERLTNHAFNEFFEEYD